LAFQDLFGRGFPRRLPEGRIQETSENRDPSESGLRFHRTDTAPAHVAQTQRPCRTTRPGMRTPVCFVAGNDAPLIDELAATRGRGAMEGGDAHADVKPALSVRAPASRTGSSGGNRDRSAATPRTGSRPTMSVACLCWSICFFSAAMYASSTLTSVLSSASWNRSLGASVARASEDSRSLTAMKPLASEFKSFAAAFRASE
jgi:hypothetical protein